MVLVIVGSVEVEYPRAPTVNAAPVVSVDEVGREVGRPHLARCRAGIYAAVIERQARHGDAQVVGLAYLRTGHVDLHHAEVCGKIGILGVHPDGVHRLVFGHRLAVQV